MTSLPLPTEAEEGKVLVAYLRIRNIKFHHSPNETGSSPEARRRAIRMKQQGTSPGFPDYTIVVGGHLIFIELKRRKGGSVSPLQHDWIKALNEIDNVQAFVAKGADEAIKIVEAYATGKPVKEIITDIKVSKIDVASEILNADIF
jgi:hypothetical protein